MAKPEREIKEGLIEFLWPAPTEGVRIEGTKRPLRQLVWPLYGDVKVDNPLLKRSLFREFAEIEPGDRGILRFARSHGVLTKGAPYPQAGSPEEPRTGIELGEPIALWREETHAMRQAVNLWDAIRCRDQALLQRCISIQRGPGVRAAYNCAIEGFGILTSFVIVDEERGINSWRADYLRGGNLFMAGLFALQDFLNPRLEVHTAARTLCTDRGDMSASPITEDLGLHLHLVPKDLLGALWLQLSSAIDEGRAYKRCACCEKWMEISLHAEGSRIDRKHCSPACRQKALRDRQTRARKMSADGRNITEIARAIESSVETVRRWVGTPLRSRGRPRKNEDRSNGAGS